MFIAMIMIILLWEMLKGSTRAADCDFTAILAEPCLCLPFNFNCHQYHPLLVSLSSASANISPKRQQKQLSSDQNYRHLQNSSPNTIGTLLQEMMVKMKKRKEKAISDLKNVDNTGNVTFQIVCALPPSLCVYKLLESYVQAFTGW